MRRKTRDFGRLKLVAIFLFVAVLLPKFINANAANDLGSFAEGETGIKLCAIIDGGNEDALRFYVSSDQGFSSDVIVTKDSCRTIETSAANYRIRQYVPQEYALESVSGGTVNADDTSFVATSTGQYAVIYKNTFASKPYLHAFGYTSSNATATAVEVSFDANGGAGDMPVQKFGLNAEQNLSTSTFTREKYNFTGWNTKADGTGESYTNGQALTFATGGELKLYAQWEFISREAADIVKSLASNLSDQEIDFIHDARWDNGEGVNKFTENGQDVYYFRGKVTNNNVIWANKCWKIVRTTATGGTKMIYNGEVDTEENSDGDLVPMNTCTADGTDIQITYGDKSTFSFSKDSKYKSPADVGYMFGDRIEAARMSAGDTVFVFANDVVRNGDVYTLSTDAISGTWADRREDAAVRYHYFCTNGADSCGINEIGYIHYFGDGAYIHYLNIGGYDDIEAAKVAMSSNETDSNAKATVEAWFEAEGLDTHENDLEDTIFCNDRSYAKGALKGKDSDASNGVQNAYGANGRNTIEIDDNFHPSLDCANKNDAFTKDDTVNGNGKLLHKVGLITADELVLAGSGWTNSNRASYLSTSSRSWTASPSSFVVNVYSSINTTVFALYVTMENHTHVGYVADYGLRPVVSLKAGTMFKDGGDGTSTNPYIVE